MYQTARDLIYVSVCVYRQAYFDSKKAERIAKREDAKKRKAEVHIKWRFSLYRC